MGGKLLNGLKSMYVDSSVCVRVKRDESEWFRTDSGVRQGCIMSPWLFNVYMDGVLNEVKMGMGRRRVSYWRTRESGDYLASCMHMTWFYAVSRRRT